jgi:hypothetical protein
MNTCGFLVLYSTDSCNFVSRVSTSCNTSSGTDPFAVIFHVDGTTWASLDILFLR